MYADSFSEEGTGPVLDCDSDVFMDSEKKEWIHKIRIKLDLLQQHLHIAYRSAVVCVTHARISMRMNAFVAGHVRMSVCMNA